MDDVVRAAWRAAQALGVVVALAACASSTSTSTSTSHKDAADPLRVNVVVTALNAHDGGHGQELFRNKATFGVRSAREGKADRVVALPGLGEIQTGVVGHETCRFVWSRDGLDRLWLYDGDACPAPEGGRMCFDQATFTRPGPPGGAGADDSTHAPPRTLVVDGCADENDLLWSKLDDGAALASVGPSSFRQRCRKIPRKRNCELTYVKKQSIDVASNDSGDDGFSLAYDGERWRVCFLERTTGAYAIDLVVEDTCGAQGPLRLEGDSSELDD